MKIIRIAIFVFTLFSISYGQDSLKNSITTFGTVQLNIPADYAQVSFIINANGSTLREAVDKAKKVVQSITTDLFEMGLSKNSISTTHFYSGENFGGKSFFTSKNDYKTEITTFVRVDSLDILEDVVLKISDHKPDEISDISFQLNNPENYKMKAINEAIKKAKQKAIILAKEMDVEIDKPIKIKELFVSQEANYNFRGQRTNHLNAVYMVDGVDQLGQSIYSEKIKVEAQVELIVLIK